MVQIYNKNPNNKQNQKSDIKEIGHNALSYTLYSYL